MASPNYAGFSQNIEQMQQAKQEDRKKKQERVEKFQDMIIESQLETKLQRSNFQQRLKEAQNLPRGEGYSWSLSPKGDLSIKYSPPKEKKETATETYTSDLKKAKGGELPWADLKFRYPRPSRQDEIEKVRKSLLPRLQKSPTFKRGFGLPAFFNRNKAKINPATNEMIGAIKSQEDLEKVIKNREFLEPKGIDINAILEYFGQRGQGNKQVNFGQIPGT